jgi:hypothetical protein
LIGEASWVGNSSNFMDKNIQSLVSQRLAGSAVNLEKAVFALEYVAQLKEVGLDFVFKGGSAVQILLGDRWNRLSIDVDICTDASEKTLAIALDSIKKKFGNKDFAYELRGEEILGAVPFLSFRVTTPPITDKGRVILLDAMGLKPHYATQSTPLKSFYYDSSVSVVTPTIGAILGDKLSTIGPNTVGRAMKDSRNGLEYAKHFYDINALSHAEPLFGECCDAYYESLGIQSKVRDTDFSFEECIDDAVFTCQVASLPQIQHPALLEKLEPERRVRAQTEHDILKRGLRGFQPFLVRGISYSWENLREYASRTALLLKATSMRLSSKTMVKILDEPPPTTREGIQNLMDDITSLQLPEEQLWFIEAEEILNFPQVLKQWHSYFTLEEKSF